MDFWGVLGTLDPPKLVFRLCEVLFFEKSIFSDQMRFLIDCLMILGGILGAKLASKWIKTTIETLMDFLIAPRRGLGRQK